MQIIVHRKNTIKELQESSANYGVEVDIRSNNGELIINHDPLAYGVHFEDWVTHYRHKTLILNVKEEGLEPKLIELMQKVGVEDYFFLDQSFPFLIKYASACMGRAAVRVSEYESVLTALHLVGKVKWVWIDCFEEVGIKQIEMIQQLHQHFKICLVSPELHNLDRIGEQKLYLILTILGIIFNMEGKSYFHIRH